MNDILISIKPKYCELICSGEKTVEVRRTRPKCEVPFKCYIYCTKDNTFAEKTLRGFYDNGKAIYYKANKGKVIGEFVCDMVYDLKFLHNKYSGKPAGTYEQFICENSCLSFDDIKAYGKGKSIYGWHITELVVYDEPRELSEFYTEGDCDCMNCKKCYWFDKGNGYNVENDCNLAYKCVELHKSFKPIIRPPQSWCYIEPRQTAD